MSTVTSEYIECPRCESKIRQEEGTPPSFCLQCRFPIMLVAGKYRLVGELGEGGFGTVYEATHIHLTRDPKRVVKILKPELLKEETMRQRFAREVQVTSALSQKNHHIVRVYDDFGEIPNLGLFYVMEYLQGQPLNELLEDNDGLLPLERCFHYFEQLCLAMHDAHSEGIIHRDLKPQNIFIVKHLRDDNHLKVIDFGIAKPTTPSKKLTNRSQGMLGTPTYMAPEQLSRKISPQVDIYAMGAIMYELLAGHPPFASADGSVRSVAEIIAAKLMEMPPPVHRVMPPGREIPPDLSAVITKALAQKPEERYLTVEQLEQAFEEAISSPPLELRPKVPQDDIDDEELPTIDKVIRLSKDGEIPKLDMRATLPYAVELGAILPESMLLAEVIEKEPFAQLLEFPDDEREDEPPAIGAETLETPVEELDLAVEEEHTLSPEEPVAAQGLSADFFEDPEEPDEAPPAPPKEPGPYVAPPVPEVGAATLTDVPLPGLESPENRQRVWLLFLVCVAIVGVAGGWFHYQRSQRKKRAKPAPVQPLQPAISPTLPLQGTAAPPGPTPKPRLRPKAPRASKRRTSRRRAARRRTNRRRKTRRRRRGLSWGRRVSGCPKSRKYYWVRLAIKGIPIEKLRVTLTPQGRIWRRAARLCVGIRHKNSSLLLRSLGTPSYTRCSFSLYPRPRTLKARLQKAAVVVAISPDYCLSK